MEVINREYFQKSTGFLFPLLGTEREVIKGKMPISYLDNITDLELIVDYTRCSEEYILKCTESPTVKEEIEDKVFTHDIINWEEDVNKFLLGQYSKLSDKAKRAICNYWGFKIIPDKPYLLGYTVLIALYPHHYYDLASNQLKMNINKGELCSVFDLDKELKYK